VWCVIIYLRGIVVGRCCFVGARWPKANHERFCALDHFDSFFWFRGVARGNFKDERVQLAGRACARFPQKSQVRSKPLNTTENDVEVLQ
jgi:hypothetical protein